jgi:hypothetical protein
LVWIQHITCNGCILSKVEQRLIGDSSSFVDPIFELFHVESSKELSVMTVTLISTIGVGLLGLEWIARVHHKLLPVAVFATKYVADKME